MVEYCMPLYELYNHYSLDHDMMVLDCYKIYIVFEHLIRMFLNMLTIVTMVNIPHQQDNTRCYTVVLLSNSQVSSM